MNSSTGNKRGLLAIIGPGLLVAATGVGAGDLAGGSLAGIHVGVAILWAVVLGAFLKFVITEGLTRWQLATGQTILEGTILRLGTPVRIIFLIYLLLWSFFVGSALMGACGVTAHALVPVFDDARQGKIIFGVLHSVVGVILVRFGGFKLFEKVMSTFIAVMFVTVIYSALRVGSQWDQILRGLFIPTVPNHTGQELSWTIALMGGVGGTLTVMCYGYWIRQDGRGGTGDLRLCRIDLAVGYLATALFGIAMVILGSALPAAKGGGAGLVVKLADLLNQEVGPVLRWVFLIGAWGAVFSSLLGVWQAVPYIFADYWRLATQKRTGETAPSVSAPIDPNEMPYRTYLAAIAIIPMSGLLVDFRVAAKYYAFLGAWFVPMLAVVLLILNGRSEWVGRAYRNKPLTVIVLVITIGLSGFAGYTEIRKKWKTSPSPPPPVQSVTPAPTGP